MRLDGSDDRERSKGHEGRLSLVLYAVNPVGSAVPGFQIKGAISPCAAVAIELSEPTRQFAPTEDQASWTIRKKVCRFLGRAVGDQYSRQVGRAGSSALAGFSGKGLRFLAAIFTCCCHASLVASAAAHLVSHWRTASEWAGSSSLSICAHTCLKGVNAGVLRDDGLPTLAIHRCGCSTHPGQGDTRRELPITPEAVPSRFANM